MDNRPIGIFDSGVGGLTIVSEVMKALPDEQIIYFGDTARVPYGSKTKETVTRFSRQIMNFLISKDVKAIIVACNTICTNSFDILKSEFTVPLLDVVNPGVETCLESTLSNRVGVIGTEATIRSGKYESLLKEKRPEINVFSKACPLFVPLAEEGWTSNSVASITTEIYLQELLDKEIDCLVLGCTHYPLLYDCISRTVGSVKIVNPAKAVAQKMRKFLRDKNLLTGEKGKEHMFYVSDNSSKFNRICKSVLHRDYDAIKVDIDKY